MRLCLKKSEILRGRNVFAGILRRGKRLKGNVLDCTYLIRQLGSTSHTLLVGFSVSRKLKRAVDRNRVRRLIREAYRLNKPPGVQTTETNGVTAEVIFLYPRRNKPPTPLPSYRDVETDVVALLASIVEYSGTLR